MRLSDIKTQNEAWEVADIWYQRAKRMNEIWQDETITVDHRLKAHKIFIHYGKISLLMAQKLNNIPRDNSKFKKGNLNIF